MKDSVQVKKKIGDVLCDIGKYMLTVIPFTYMMSDKPAISYVVIMMAFWGLLFILFGLFFIKKSESKDIRGNSRKKKIRILKNAVFVVEEETDAR
jgi:hypothetical protein